MIFNIDIRSHDLYAMICMFASRIHIVINLGYDFNRNDRRRLRTCKIRVDLRFCEI